MNILIVAIFYLVLQLGDAEKDVEKTRQEKGLKLEIPIENIAQLSALNIQANPNPNPSVQPQLKNINNGPGRFGHGAKVPPISLRKNQNQPDKTDRKGLLEAFLLSSLLSGNAGITVTQGTNKVCEAGCSAAEGSFSSGECFGLSPYYASDQCDCLCKYAVQDDYTSDYDLCSGNSCQLYCQGLFTPDASIIPQSRTGGDLMFITGRCDYGACYCCGRPFDYPLA